MSDLLPSRSGDVMTMWTDAPPEPQKQERDPLFLYRMAFRALRGRYALVVLLALAGAGAGAIFMRDYEKAVFRSEGLVRIPFRRAPLSDEAEKLRQMAVFQEFLKSQVQVMTGSHVIERAITKWPGHPEDETTQQRAKRFARNLTVEHPADTQHLTIAFKDTDPKLAAAGVNAIIDAYIECDEIDIRSRPLPTTRDRESGREDFQKEMALLQGMEHEIAQQFDPSEPGHLKDGIMTKSGQSMDELFKPRVGVNDKVADGPLTINQIGILDPLMRDYLSQQSAMKAEMEQLTLAGAGDKNPRMILLQQKLASHKQMMERYAEDYRKFQTSARNPVSPVAAGAVDTRHRLAELRLAEVDRQISELKTGGTFAGKVEVITKGTVPLLAFKDRRLIMMGIGGMAGAAFPAVLLVLVGLLNRRVESADDIVVSARSPALLGILPQLPRGKLKESKRALWSFCVHQVRVMLEARHAHQRPPAYLITSASPGEGKTRLTTALAKSFAESGSKTLMIDCDLISQGLTHRFGVEPDQDLISCLREGTLLGAIQTTSDRKLALLPLRDDRSVKGLPKASIRRLLDEARRHFDVILIDSGSVLGSIEASLLAPEVDGVILAVTRGQHQPLVERSIQHLQGVGANVLGAVFNRAKFTKLRTSTPAPSRPLLSSQLEATAQHHAPVIDEPPPLPDAPIANAT